MSILAGLAWTLLFFAAVLVGDNPFLLDHIPLPFLIGLFMGPWIYIAARAARGGSMRG
jgi:hypothetical protein